MRASQIRLYTNSNQAIQQNNKLRKDVTIFQIPEQIDCKQMKRSLKRFLRNTRQDKQPRKELGKVVPLKFQSQV